MNKRPRSSNKVNAPFKKPRPALARQQSMAMQANTLRGGPEKKDIENTQSLTVPIAGTAIQSTLLTQVAQGTTNNTRLGRKIRLLKLTLRWQAQLAANTLGGTPLRIKIVYDKQTNGAAMATTDVVYADLFYAPNNLDNTDRFITLIDEITEPMSIQNNFSIGGQFNRKIDLEQVWLGQNAGGAIADLLTGSVYMFVWQTGAATVGAPTFQYITRIRYTDN